MAARRLSWNVVWLLTSFPLRQYYCQSRHRRKGDERDADHTPHVIPSGDSRKRLSAM